MMTYKKIIACLVSVSIMTAGFYSYAESTDKSEFIYDLDETSENFFDNSAVNDDCGYIFTIKEPEITLMNTEDVDVISATAGVYHADSLEDLQKISENIKIDKIARDIPVHLLDEPNDPYYTIQWASEACNYSAFWNNNITGENIRVAVIDTGLDETHDDFKNLNVSDGINICAAMENNTDRIWNTSDQNGHGTSVTSVIAAGFNNEVGLSGITDKCTIIPIRIFDNESSYSLMTSALLNAIEYARQINCDVLNMSLGFTNPDDELIEITEELIDSITNSGTIVVAASGNTGATTNNLEYPAACENVVSVAATAQSGTKYIKADFSTANDSVYISAPGKNVVTANLNNAYIYRNGTSFACPVVAAAAAGAKFINSEIDTNMFRSIIKSTAIDIDEEGYDINTGWGMIDFNGVYEDVIKTVQDKPESTETPTPSDEPSETEKPITSPVPSDEPTETTKSTEEPIATETPVFPTSTSTPTPTVEPTIEPIITPKPAIETAIIDNVDSVQFIVYNNTDEKIYGTGVVAVYHKDGSLWNLTTVQDINYKRLVYNLPVKSSELDVKFFMWDSLESMKPVDFNNPNTGVQTMSHRYPSQTVLFEKFILD